MATVDIKSVNKSYDDHSILNNINLNIEKGEFVALVGPSGSGKSTLLRLVAGLETVTEGSILINNQCVNKMHPSKRNMAMVFQSYALYPHMTVFANMAYGLKMRGMDKASIQQRVEEVSDLLQIKPYLNRKPSALSGGQRQRVAMGRAIVRDPAVFLFDEPLSNLDTKLRAEMRHEIKKLHQKLNTTCIYVTHDQTEAMTLADRIVLLNHGNIEQVGSPQELYLHPETMFVGSFIGHYAMNFIPGVVDDSNAMINTSIGMSFSLPSLDDSKLLGKEVMIGVRPEHIIVHDQSDANRVLVDVDFIDDMGADQLIQTQTAEGHLPFSIRTQGGGYMNNRRLSLAIDLKQANLYCKQSGKRVGNWNE
jgi:ABC-type sugar transport system ATPase subunit